MNTAHTSNTSSAGNQLNNTAMQASMKAANLVVNPTPHTDSVETNRELEAAGIPSTELGQFKAYDSQLTIPEIAGTRIIKCLYQKNPSTGEKLRENSYIRITCKHLTEEHVVARIAELTPFIVSWLQDIEGSMIRDKHKKGQLNIFPATLSLDALIESLEASSEGARLNKEKIEAWFTATIEEDLQVLFAEKMGLEEDASEEQLEKLEMVVAAYKGKFASLASGKTYIKEDDCIALIGVIERCPEAKESLIGARFIARLEKMKSREDTMLLSL